MVRVLVDATALPTNRGGVGRYLDALLTALAGPAGSGAEVVVATKPADRAGYAALGLEVVSGPRVLDRRPVRLGWEQTGLLGLVRRVRPDVLHSPHYTQPLLARLPTVVTVHDATFFTDPQLHSAVKARFFRAATRWAARRATRLIVPSEATRQELAERAQLPVGKVTVAPLGVDRAAFHPAHRGGCGAPAPAAGPGRRAVRRLSGHDRAAQERERPGPGLGAGRPGSAQSARAGRGGRPGVGRHGRRGRRRCPGPTPGRPARLPGARRPTGAAGRCRGRRVPQPGRGFRPAGPGGDGLRRDGAHDPAVGPARGRRRRGRLHRTGRRGDRGGAARAPRGRRDPHPARQGRGGAGRPVHLGTVRRAARRRPTGRRPRRADERRRGRRDVLAGRVAGHLPVDAGGFE